MPPSFDDIVDHYHQTAELSLDGFLYLGSVKLHLADHKPMTEGDEEAWRICDWLQDLEVSRGGQLH